MVRAVRYRVKQFWQAITARHAVSEGRIARAAQGLPPEARVLFARQAPQDQRHALAVYETLRREEHTQQDLLAAALLHDVGKAATRLPAWRRGLFVLAEHFLPGMLDRAIRGPFGSRRRLLADYAEHAEIGARWAEEAGCSPMTVTLIRRHEERLETCRTEEDRLLLTLQAADGAN
ncbi:MAG: hypothetical protein PVG25_01575 [Anaerolineae bacterium]|jgi:hypothetical protein